MAEAKLYGQNKGGMSIDGIIKNYYAYAGESISAGDLVEYVNGVSSTTSYGESVDTQLTTTANTAYQRLWAVQLDDSRVFVTHDYGGSGLYNLYGMVITISGKDIILGTDTKLTTQTYGGQDATPILLSTGKVFISHMGDGSNMYLYGTICTISGTTITTNTTKLINNAQKYSGNSSSVKLLDGDVIFTAFQGYSNNYLYGVAYSISGTTFTIGTYVQLSSYEYAGRIRDVELLPDGQIFVAHNYNSSNYQLYGLIASVSDLVISKGSGYSIDTNASLEDNRDFSMVCLDNGDVFIAYGKSYLYGIICKVDGKKITHGTRTQLSTVSSSASWVSAILLQDNKVFIAHSGGSYLYGMVCTINDTEISKGVDTQLSNVSASGFRLFAILLRNGLILIPHSYTSSYYLYAQIFSIAKTTNTPTNNIIVTEYETQVRKITTGQFDGVAKKSGIGGDDTGHKDLVSIWTLE